MTAVSTSPAIDLRRSPLAEMRARDLRSSRRDLWADEVALWDRLSASWAGLDDAAWHLPGAAPSDAGGPDWSLAEHVGHVAAWQELAIGYTAHAIETGVWPSDADYDGGDFDRYNERLREPWASMPRDEIIRRLRDARDHLLVEAGRLGPAEIRGDAAWGWVYTALHGHYLDHLVIIEPWTETLRRRQADGDPFIDDPRAASHEAFRDQTAPILADLDGLLRDLPFVAWTEGEVSPGWTVRDHVGHLADWATEGARAVDVYLQRGHWLADPEEGLDAWNERMVARSRHETPMETRARFDRSWAAMMTATDRLSIDDLRSADGWSWAYDCLHGHVRKHLAMLGPWVVRRDWPGA